MKKQTWVVVDQNYLSYLRKHELRIPYSDYGENKFKPFFGILSEQNGLRYVTQISHAQSRHEKLDNAPDFHKIFLPDNSSGKDKLTAVVNLNYMFPVPPRLVKQLDYRDLSKYCSFSSDRARNQYINLLRKELKQINSLGLENDARQIYALKYASPMDGLSRRCLDFKALETLAHNYPL